MKDVIDGQCLQTTKAKRAQLIVKCDGMCIKDTEM